jgi:4-hydroxybenzoate polyprenyltransferase
MIEITGTRRAHPLPIDIRGPAGLAALWWGESALCWRESRPAVQIIFQIRFLVGFMLCGGSSVARLAVAAPLWLCATMAVYLLNGYTDVTEDRLNGSRRPVAAGLLPARHALGVALGLGTVALVGAALAEPLLVVLVAVLLLLGAYYSLPPVAAKRWTLGVSVIAGLGGFVTYLAGAVAAGRFSAHLLPFAGLLTAWMAVVGALTKDLSDVAGDVAAGRRTAVVLRSERGGHHLVAGGALAVGGAALAVGGASGLVLPAAVVAGGAVAVAVCTLSRYSTGSRARRRRPYRIFMVVQYVAHVALLLTMLAQ